MGANQGSPAVPRYNPTGRGVTPNAKERSDSTGSVFRRNMPIKAGTDGIGANVAFSLMVDRGRRYACLPVQIYPALGKVVSLLRQLTSTEVQASNGVPIVRECSTNRY